MKVYSCRMMNVTSSLYKGIAVPAALYGAVTWNMAVADKRLNVMQTSEKYVCSNAYGPNEKLCVKN